MLLYVLQIVKNLRGLILPRIAESMEDCSSVALGNDNLNLQKTNSAIKSPTLPSPHAMYSVSPV